VSSVLRIKRDRGYVDIARTYEVLVNEEPVGTIRNGGELECAIPNGRSSVRIRLDWCGSNTIEIEAAEGGVVELECGSNLRGWKVFRASRVMRESPNEWIWVRAKNNAI
jgi:hypothetical protein